MNRIVFVVAIALAALAWQASERHARRAMPAPATDREVHGSGAAARTDFHCDGRRYCSQMRSRAEAEFFNARCPDTRMDGDHDGIPCENDSRF